MTTRHYGDRNSRSLCQDCRQTFDTSVDRTEFMLCDPCKQKRRDDTAQGSYRTTTSIVPDVSTSANEAQDQGADCSVISSLVDLDRINDDHFTQSFCDSLDVVFRYAVSDIQVALQRREMEALSCLHRTLCDKAVSIFPQYKDKRIVNRQVKHTIVPDICNLGFSVVNKSVHKDLYKIFTSNGASDNPSSSGPNGHNMPSVSEVTRLLEIVTKLQTKVNAMEKDIINLKANNEQRQTTILALQEPSQAYAADATPPSQNSVSNSIVQSEHPDTSNSIESSMDTTDPPLQHEIVVTSQPGSIESATAESTPVNTDIDNASSLPISDTSDSEDDDRSGEFSFQRTYKKKLAKLEKRISKLCDKLETRPSSSEPKEQILTPSQVSPDQDKLVYVGGVDPRHPTEAVHQYVTSLGIHRCTITQLAANKDYKSFRVSVPASHYDTILDTRNWSETITIRPFRNEQPPRRRQTGPRDRRQQSNSWQGQTSYGR